MGLCSVLFLPYSSVFMGRADALFKGVQVSAELKIQNLGVLEGPLLIFGGPYSNLEALQTLRGLFPEMPPRNVICTGDVVAYCADAHDCVQEIRDWGVVCVAGNCEKQLAIGAADCGCGFEEGTVCDALSARWFAHASSQITSEDREWMGHCPDIVVFQHSGQTCAVIHGGVTDIARFIWPVSDENVFEHEIHALKAVLAKHGLDKVDRIYAGHCGIPFERKIGDLHWINAGVIGMPPHHGGADTRYVLVNKDGDSDIKSMQYPSDKTSAKMILYGLKQGYEKSLQTGFWPSEDVLPQTMRQR